MGSIRSGLSVLFVLGACGDNLGGDLDLPGGPTDQVNPSGAATDVPRYTPAVCGVNEWSPSVAIDPAMAISVTQRPGGGATLFGVPLAGGAPVGFNLDPRMNMVDEGQKIVEGRFQQVTASYLQDRPVAAGISDGAIYLHLLDADLTAPQYIAKLPGTHLGEPTFLSAGGNLVMPAVDDSGLWLHRFADSLEPLDSKLVAGSKPGQALTATQVGTSLMAAWSSASSCNLMVTSTYEPGVITTVDTACLNPQLAINQATSEGVMLFDSPEGVRLMTIQPTHLAGDASIIRAGASSPRVVFDGTNFWVSYLDQRGELNVGFLDRHHQPVTMSLGAPQPERAAFELAMIDGKPWVFSVDAGGYTGYRMCVETTF